MEVPIPNFFFMGIQFIHLLALSIWVGGIVAIGMIVAPILFRRIKSRRTAGDLMGEILRKFDLLSLFCIAALIITGMIKYWTWENLTPWNLTRYLAILVMSGGGFTRPWSSRRNSAIGWRTNPRPRSSRERLRCAPRWFWPLPVPPPSNRSKRSKRKRIPFPILIDFIIYRSV